jgi:hypothetical protein
MKGGKAGGMREMKEGPKEGRREGKRWEEGRKEGRKAGRHKQLVLSEKEVTVA